MLFGVSIRKVFPMLRDLFVRQDKFIPVSEEHYNKHVRNLENRGSTELVFENVSQSDPVWGRGDKIVLVNYEDQRDRLFLSVGDVVQSEERCVYSMGSGLKDTLEEIGFSGIEELDDLDD